MTIVPIKDLGRLKTLSLVVRVLRFLFGIMWAQRVRHETPAVIAARVRNFLEDMGGLWVKAGQLISLRTDLLSPEMADQLTQLQYRAYGFAPEIARQIVAETLGRPIEQVFDVFEDHPFAAASISQEHRAHLRREGAWVVVKVQRPGIGPIFERDLRVIGWLARWGAKAPGMAYAGFDKLFRELQNIMREEIDYRYETSNLRRMRKSLRRHRVYVPKVFVEYGGAAGHRDGADRRPAHVRLPADGAQRSGPAYDLVPGEQRQTEQSGFAAHAELFSANVRGQSVSQRPASGEHHPAPQQSVRSD